MQFKHWLSAPFKFTAIPVSILAAVIYGVVFTSVLVTDETPAVPENLGGLNLNQAYDDLHRITARPHPVTSHANDEVHDYLLNRLQPVVAASDYIHISEDLVSNATYVTAGAATYFEGTNILVKVDGTDAPDLKSNGVVFSAHYDSVSTAPGATDNGMSVVTLMQLVQYLSDPKRRPRKTAVFLFNNGEEDGLNGVHMYFEHPWSNLTTTFVNLEGAAAGGRAILFRSNSLAAVRSFAANGVPHPHGNVISADAFARGVIRSRTDYEVFAKGIRGEKDGMTGFDFAFYKNRAYYHTLFDSIPGMGRSEGRKALWSLMETTRGAGLALLNDEVAGDAEPGVYFDVLGHAMVTFSMQTLLVTHLVLLIIGPISVLGLLAWVLILGHDTHAYRSEEPATYWTRFKKVIAAVMGWGRFWFTLLIAIGAQVGLVVGYVKINPFIAYSKPYIVLITTLALSFLSLVFTLALFSRIWPSPPSSQKFAIIIEVYLLSWIFLVAATVALNNLQVGGVYLITVWNFCAWLASILALTEAVVRAKRDGTQGARGELDLIGEPEPSQDEPERHFVRGVRYDASPNPNGADPGYNDIEPEETEPTEITPLMQQQRRHSTGGREYIVGVDNQPILVDAWKTISPEYEESGWWILQMLALAFAPAVLWSQIDVVLMHSLSNTMADGSPPVVVYGGLSLLSFFIFVNIAPFAHRIHRGLFLPVLVLFVVTLAIAWISFPFAQEAPLKIFFQQSVELGLSSHPTLLSSNEIAGPVPISLASPSHSIVRSVTRLTGLVGYTDKKIIPELPSSWDKNVTCGVDNVLRKGLWSCGWDSDLLPSPGGNLSLQTSPHWLTLKTERLNDTSARFTLQGVNTRACKLYFNNSITAFEVLGSGGRLQPGYEMPKDGVDNIWLWSRTWDKEFVVDVRWGGTNATFPMEGRAACQWAEYASSTASGPHASISARIPALEEVLQFFPLWATPTKWTAGLVEAWTRFSV